MEILATIPVYSYPWIYNLSLVISLVCGIVIGISCICAFFNCFDNIVPLILGLIFLSLGIVGVIHSVRAIERTSYLDYTKYKVTINEEIGARELLDEYEILSREGEIFTIKEIEVDE